MPETILTTTQVARRLGVKSWQIRRIFEDGMLHEPARFGISRAIPESLLPDIEAALRVRGWLKAKPTESLAAAG